MTSDSIPAASANMNARPNISGTVSQTADESVVMVAEDIVLQAMVSYDPNCHDDGCNFVPDEYVQHIREHQCDSDHAHNSFYQGKLPVVT